MPKAEVINNQDGQPDGWIIFCLACNDYHVLDYRWTFNGNFESPSFTPSLRITPPQESSRPSCHSWIESGTIKYYEDSTHGMAGQTTELPEIPNR